MTGDFDGSTVLVTGGTRGIGLAVAEQVVREGGRVVITGRDETVGSAAARRLGDDRAVFVRGDAAREFDVRAAVDACHSAFGPVDALITSAGVNANFDLRTMSEQEWDEFFGIDLKSAWLASKHVVPDLERSGGAIVHISSIHAQVTLEGFFPYAAAKAGLVGLTRSMALDLGSSGVRVNCVAPGFTRTRLVQQSLDRNPDPAAAEVRMVAGVALGRIGEPSEVAEAVCFLASRRASYVTGATLFVDGGLTARRSGT